MNVTKAIIPVAGWGTRRLPITKTIEKCMLPIGNRPIVDYVVQDCLAAGVTELIFVVGEDSTQLEDYYRTNIKLNDYLKRNGKEDRLAEVAPLQGVQLHFVTQGAHDKYGTAVPVALAADYVEDGESVVVLMGDDFFYNADGSSEVKHLIDNTPDGRNGILGAVFDANHPRKRELYGSIEANDNDEFIRIVEHPEVLPDPFIKNVSKYLLTSTMVQAVRDYVRRDDVQGEYYIFTPFEPLLVSGEQTMKLTRAHGQYLDGGTLEGWLHANNVVCGLE